MVIDTNKREHLQTRSRILDFEDLLKQGPHWEGDNDYCPLTHQFPKGMYVRTIQIPAGVVLTGKLHRWAHPNFLHYGVVQVATEFGGVELLKGPKWMISRGLTKRALVAITDLKWTTIHANPNELRDPEELEREIIIGDLTEYKKELCLLEQSQR